MSEFPLGIAIPQRGPSPSNPSIAASPASFSRPPALTPSSQSSNPFDNFSVPSIPPRLSRVGRRISEMGMSVLVGPDYEDEPPPPRREAPVRAAEVPGMGDEPIMCPFCNKPLPPAFILTQMAHTHASSQEKKRTQDTLSRKSSVSSRRPSEMGRSASGSGAAPMGMTRVPEGSRAESVAMSATASAPSSVVQARRAASSGTTTPPSGIALSAAKSTPDLSKTDALLESTRPQPGEVLPKATAESLLPTVKSAETADIAGASSLISPEDVRKWSTLAGIDISTSSGTSTPKKAEKAIPALSPPPPPSSTVAERMKQSERPTSGSKFGGIFGRGTSKAKDEDSDDEEDGSYGAAGYAKLNGPPSPDRDEAPSWRDKARRDVPGRMTQSPAGLSRDPSVEPARVAAKDKVASDEELRKLLVEVLGKVDSMSKSHEDLLHSHTTLLTSLKIARSNLAMAEANSEMLEEQLKRAPPPPSTRPPNQPQASTRPSTPSNAPATAPVPSRSSSSIPTINIPARKSLDEPRPLQPMAPRRSEETRRARPTSMMMPPPNAYNSGPSTGPASSTSQKESKGMFGFLGGGKTKVPGLGTIVIPSAKELQASAVRFGDSIAGPSSRPGTPSREAGQFFDYHVPSQYAPVQNENRSTRSVSGDSISRVPSPISSANTAAPPASSPLSGSSLQSPPTVRPQPLPPALTAELAKLRTAYTTSQTRMEAMNKELTELKKGKLEMEAELESLSQALFEEANKMVSEERKRRAEVEESLKEVKEEREALRETIKVLGGQAESVVDEDESKEAGETVEHEDEEEEKKGDDWRPRDLDKHYEALRKTIHHVADGTAPTTAFEDAVAGPTGTSARGSTDTEASDVPTGRKVSSGMRAEANPWAEMNFGAVIPPGAGMSAQVRDDVDPLAKMTADGSGIRGGAADELARAG